MKKIKEDQTYVWYSFETHVWEDIGLRDKRGFRIEESKIVIGVCLFNKITRAFNIDYERTDPYFLQKHHYEVKWVEGRLQRLQTLNKGYPELEEIAFG